MGESPSIPGQNAPLPEPVAVVDARGHRCPVPTLRLRRALEGAEAVRLLADDPMARIDVPHFAAQAGHDLAEVSEADGGFSFLVRRR